MKTIKVKELLDKIFNEEELPAEVVYYGKVYKKYEFGGRVVDYFCGENSDDNLIRHIIDECYLINALDSELDIVEDEPEAATPDKLEKVTFLPYSDKVKSITILAEKINEIIDKLNKEGN